MIYTLTKNLILTNNYEKEDMLTKLDLYVLMNRITAEQYIELVDLIDQKESEVE